MSTFFLENNAILYICSTDGLSDTVALHERCVIHAGPTLIAVSHTHIHYIHFILLKLGVLLKSDTKIDHTMDNLF